MTVLRPLLLCVLCLPLIASAQSSADDLVAAAQLRETARAGTRALDIATSLVKDVGPRFAGSAGDAKAVAWAQRAMAAAGLQRIRTQPVRVPHWVRGALEVTLDGAPLVATALGGSVATPRGGVEARVLMVESLDALRELPPEQVKGAIVFFNTRMSRSNDGSGYGSAVRVRTRGAAEAGRRGALAAVIRSIGTSDERVAHTGRTQYDDAAPKIAALALSNADADRLEARLAQGEARLRIRLEARMQADTQSANVIGEIPGETDEIILLGAHLDSWDITPGANDDAAGVAIALEAARLIGSLKRKPRRTIRVVLFANEEFGLDGAKTYARSENMARHVLALEADLGSAPVLMLDAGVAPAAWPQVQGIAQALLTLGVKLGVNGKNGAPDVSMLNARGVPVLAPRQDATRYFDVHHTAADTIDRLDRAGLEQNVAVYAVAAYLAAQSAQDFGRVPVTAAD